MRGQFAGPSLMDVIDPLRSAVVATSPDGRDHPGVHSALEPRHADVTGLLERSSELSCLHECSKETADLQRGRVVLVSGEAGIGKTALLRQFRAALARRYSVLS